jgi:hypothetical protein
MIRRSFAATVAATLLGPLCGPALATTLTPATGGLALTSYGTGAVGVGGALAGGFGGGWYSFFGGVASVGLIALDPPQGNFYDGKFVIVYPDGLVSPVAVGWFGNFSANPGAPIPPITTTGYLNTPTGATYNLAQAPNPAINASVVNNTSNPTQGVLTITFHAPNGVVEDTGTDFNLVGIQFQNISGQTLLWQVDTSGSPNLFQNGALQTLTCTPDPTFQVPVACGDTTGVFSYDITVVPLPEPSTLPLLFTGILGLVGLKHRRKLAARTLRPDC